MAKDVKEQFIELLRADAQGGGSGVTTQTLQATFKGGDYVKCAEAINELVACRVPLPPLSKTPPLSSPPPL